MHLRGRFWALRIWGQEGSCCWPVSAHPEFNIPVFFQTRSRSVMASQGHRTEGAPSEVRGNGNFCWVSGGSSTSRLGGVRFTQRLGDARWHVTRVTGAPTTRPQTATPKEGDEGEASDTPSMETVYITSASRRDSNDECF